MGKGSIGNNNRLYLVLGIIGIAIIIGTLIGSNYIERFTSSTTEIRLIFFSHPECSHCITFNDTWKEMQKKYKDISYVKYNINDKVENEKITYGEKYNIDGVPTIKLSFNNKLINYPTNKNRNETDIINWVRELTKK